jgi:hypothetical protein
MACLGMLVPIVAVQVPAPADAAVYRVPEDRDTIQAGILAAADGDTVLVAPGSYVENILIGRDVVVRSTGGAAVTIIYVRTARSATVRRHRRRRWPLPEWP